MNRLCFLKGLTVVILLSVIGLGSSCVNEEYDMSDLNLEVTPFEDGLTLPLGSTEQIKLTDLLKDVDTSFINVGPDGAYSIGMKDSLDMAEQLTEITDIIEIPDVDFSQNISFKLDAVDVSDIKVEAKEISFDFDFSNALVVPDFTLPDIEEHFTLEAGMCDYVPTEDQLLLSIEPIENVTKLISINESYTVSDEDINDNPISLTDGVLAQYTTITREVNKTANVSLTISLPKGINSIEDIVLHENSGLKVSVDINGSLLKSGTLIPDINLDFSQMLELKDVTDNIINLKEKMTLNETNGYAQDAVYKISSIVFDSEDWSRADEDSPIELNNTYTIPISGEFLTENMTTTTRIISQSRDMEVILTAEFVDVEIVNVDMNIAPIHLSHNNIAPITADIKDIPAEVKEISNVVLAEGSGLDFIISSKNLENVHGLNTRFDKLEIIFPDFLEVEGADADNRIIITDVNLSQNFVKHVNITGIDLPTPVDGTIIFTEEILVNATATADGIIHSSELPTRPEDDVQILVDVNSSLEIIDYDVTMSKYTHALDIEGEEISVEIPENISHLKEILIYPEGNPEVVIDLNFPVLPLDMEAANDGLCLSFPGMLKFEELPAAYNHDVTTNTITLFGELPEQIILPIETLVLNPEQDPVDMKFYSKGKVMITGGIALAEGILSKDEVNSLSDPANALSAIAHIPEITPSTLSLDEFSSDISEEVTMDIMKPEDVPAELVSLSTITLKDAFINISLDASTLPELGGGSLSVNFDVRLPEMIHVADANENGIVNLSGKVNEDGIINVDPIKVDYLDLSGINIKEDGISGLINVDGSFILSDASLDIGEWLQDDLNVKLSAGMKDIIIETIRGRVDYSIDTEPQIIDLSGFTSLLGDTTSGIQANLDFNHAHLALDIVTNLGIPVDADIEIIPYKNGVADEVNMIKSKVTLQHSESADQINTTRYYISQDDSRCPKGYTYIKGNLVNIIKTIPDKLEIRLSANTNTAKECILEPEADYILNINYDFSLPLEFGEEFEVVYKTRITDLPALLGEILSMGNKVKISGYIENNLPLALDLKLNFLDSDGKIVPLEEGSGTQHIASCGPNGEAVQTELGILVALEKDVQADIPTIELEFNANSGDVTGIPVTNEAYLQAVIRLTLPEGITVDLEEVLDLMNNNAE